MNKPVKFLILLGIVASMIAPAMANEIYDSLVHNRTNGYRVDFTGQVIQSLQEGNDYTLRVNITKEHYGWKDTVLVTYTAKPTDVRIAENDVVFIRGRSAGIQSYKAMLGQTIQLPFINACEVKAASAAGWVMAPSYDRC